MLPEPVDRWRSRQQTETLDCRPGTLGTDVEFGPNTAFLSVGRAAECLYSTHVLLCGIDLSASANILLFTREQ